MTMPNDIEEHEHLTHDDFRCLALLAAKRSSAIKSGADLGCLGNDIDWIAKGYEIMSFCCECRLGYKSFLGQHSEYANITHCF